MIVTKTIPMVIAVLVLLGPSGAAAQDAAALVGQVRAGHSSAVQSIHTLSATVRVELRKPEQRLLGAGKYWRVGNEVRVHQDGVEGSTIDYRVAGGEVRQVTLPGPNSSGQPGHASRMSEQDLTTRTNAFKEMLLVLADPDGQPRDLDAMLASASSGVTTNHRSLDGDDCILLSFSVASRRGPVTKYTLWHVPAKNYLIKRLEAVTGGAEDDKFASAVTAWAEPVPGVLVPTAVRSDHYRSGSVVQSRTSVLTDVVVNAPIAPATMALPAPRNGSVWKDDIAGVSGKVDSNWKPIGPLTAAPKQYIVPGQSAAPGSAEYTSQSTSEPKSTGFWVLVASGAFLLLTISVIAYRRFRTPASD